VSALTVERVAHTGALMVSAYVTTADGCGEGGVSEWLETLTFYGYTVSEARGLFRESLARRGYVLAS